MGSTKRARESTEEQSNESEKIMAIEEFRQRIYKDVEENGSKGTLQVKEEVDDSSKDKNLKATKKGAAVLDQ
ncbi:hypothetical protein Pint_30813 [Pistacia integerrima]|uniref:Uncharacterized protein n=1 Tax=Pistacia integerrima TaxID=434235 RepID=A0ACC0X0Y6_9ROSI|nr:hypothetical protein Pint_30813 [Pistacia integerrima]